MINLITFFVALLIQNGTCKRAISWSGVDNPLLFDHPCNGTDEITIAYVADMSPEEENLYHVSVDIEVPASSTLEMKFDSEAIVKLSNSTASSARIRTWGDTFYMRFFRSADIIIFSVQGPPLGTVPYFKSLKINTQEYCDNPKVGYLDSYITGYQDTASTLLKAQNGCGRRKDAFVPLITNGEPANAGDWPWHVAIYQLKKSSFKYTCGGTLISKTVVLTAAHCVTITGVPVAPEILNVVLGKHNLIGGDLESQEREVQSLVVHENFAPLNYLDDDIALIKLTTEAVYSNYVQPACIWYSQAYQHGVTHDSGMVVGWGFQQSDSLSTELRQASVPKVPDTTCIKKKPLFYSSVLRNNKKFCAGWANGTSPCNGDSGGGFMVFVPDTTNIDPSNVMGSWYIRGIVSLSITRPNMAICDPNQYVVFTNIEKYTHWIQKHLNSI